MYTYRYPRPAVTADAVVFAPNKDGRLCVLLVLRGGEPYRGCWAFPGGFMNMDEDAESCAIRELKEETGIDVAHLEQVGAFSSVDRDPRGRVVTVAYCALLNRPSAVSAGDDAAEARWFQVDALPPLAFDHSEIMTAAMEKIRSHAKALNS